MTRVVRADEAVDLGSAVEDLKKGHLVAFPTETVYGLGADAGNFHAVERVFEVKGRPHSDPLIVHCFSFEQSQRFISPAVTPWQRLTHRVLAEAFWPGPLTLILPAHPDRIASNVTGGSGWVGLRCPNHPVALKLLAACDLPVAAPSANLFGHVSPTCAAHVLNDFPAVDNLWIVDGGECGLGIESTVVRINSDRSIEILRRGGVGRFELANVLVDRSVFESHNVASESIRIIEKFVRQSENEVALPSPGQLLVHYAPRLATYMLSLSGEPGDSQMNKLSSSVLSKTVVIDFGGRLEKLKHICGFYKDLSPGASAKEAAQQLFSLLRWAEDRATDRIEDWQIWIFNPFDTTQPEDVELFAALADRILRAASGKAAVVSVKPDFDRVFFSVH